MRVYLFKLLEEEKEICMKLETAESIANSIDCSKKLGFDEEKAYSNYYKYCEELEEIQGQMRHLLRCLY